MRMFVAVRPPEDAIEDLDTFLDVRREAGGFRWVLADQVHVTLAFLAEVPDRNVDDGWTVRVHLPQTPEVRLEIDAFISDQNTP